MLGEIKLKTPRSWLRVLVTEQGATASTMKKQAAQQRKMETACPGPLCRTQSCTDPISLQRGREVLCEHSDLPHGPKHPRKRLGRWEEDASRRVRTREPRSIPLIRSKAPLR